MQSRRDQVQAYFFVVGRLVSAVTHGKPDALEMPNKRIRNGIVFGVLVSVLLMAIFGILGLFKPGKSTAWQQDGSIVVNKDSGAQFVYLGGQLRPVLNYSSARLAAGDSGGTVQSVSQQSLEGTPVGQPIGIPGAPDSIPTAQTLETGPWTVCVQPGAARPKPTDPVVTLKFGSRPGKSTSDGQGLLVSTPDNAVHLVWNGKRYKVPDQRTLDALPYGNVTPLQVSTAWLDPIPAGRDLALPAIEGAGSPGPVIDGKPSKVGQVYEVRNPATESDQFYLVREDGKTALNRTSAALALASPAVQSAYPGGQVSVLQAGPTALTSVPDSGGPDLVGGFPPVPPQAVVPPPDAQPCARYSPSGTGDLKVTVEMQSTSEVDAGSVALAEHVSGSMADKISLPAGRGVLAKSLPAPGAQPGAAFLITDTGTKYPLADDKVVEGLGYSPTSAVQIPDELLDLLPAGPMLTSSGAVQVQTPQPNEQP